MKWKWSTERKCTQAPKIRKKQKRVALLVGKQEWGCEKEICDKKTTKLIKINIAAMSEESALYSLENKFSWLGRGSRLKWVSFELGAQPIPRSICFSIHTYKPTYTCAYNENLLILLNYKQTAKATLVFAIFRWNCCRYIKEAISYVPLMAEVETLSAIAGRMESAKSEKSKC